MVHRRTQPTSESYRSFRDPTDPPPSFLHAKCVVFLIDAHHVYLYLVPGGESEGKGGEFAASSPQEPDLLCFPLQGRSPMFYGAVAAAGLVTGYSAVSLAAAEFELHPPKYAWSHRGLFSALDHQRSVCVFVVCLLVCIDTCFCL